MKKIVSVLLSFAFLIAFFPLTYAAADNTASFEDDPKAIQNASNSVIMLSCYDIDGKLYATGSGFALFEEGVFVTNFHVIDDEVYSIRAQMETGLEFPISSVVAYDADKDIAILRTEAKTGLAPLPIGSTAALERGEKVIAIGSPLGLINTLSIGLYSGTLKDGQVYLQFSAPISHGSSGGALFNNRGEVVGITAASFEEGQNLNLAVPIEEVVSLWENRDNIESSFTEFYENSEHVNSYELADIIQNGKDYVGRKVEIKGYVSSIEMTLDSHAVYLWLVANKSDVLSIKTMNLKEIKREKMRAAFFNCCCCDLALVKGSNIKTGSFITIVGEVGWVENGYSTNLGIKDNHVVIYVESFS